MIPAVAVDAIPEENASGESGNEGEESASEEEPVVIGTTEEQTVNVSLPVSWTEDGQAIVTFTFEFNDEMITVHQPVEIWHSGKHTILLYYPIENVLANYTNTFNVYMRVSGGTGTVDTGWCVASVSGQSMGANAAWDGAITVEDYIERVDMALSSIMTGALLSANTSRQIAHVQHAIKRQMDGHAGVLDAEIKLDSARGGDVTKKKEELEETQKKSAELAETTINTLTTANEDLQKASKEDLEAQRAEKAAEKKKAEKAAEKKKAEKEAAEERIEKAKVSTSESGEVSDEGEAVSTEGTVLDGASIDIVSSGITVSTGSVSEPAGENVDVKV